MRHEISFQSKISPIMHAHMLKASEASSRIFLSALVGFVAIGSLFKRFNSVTAKQLKAHWTIKSNSLLKKPQSNHDNEAFFLSSNHHVAADHKLGYREANFCGLR